MVYSTGASQHTYSLLCDLVISSGYFRDTDMNIFFNTTWASANNRITVQSGANLTLGVLTENITRRTTEGVNIISGTSNLHLIQVISGGVLELYGCHLQTLSSDTIQILGNATIYETNFLNIGFVLSSTTTNLNMYRVNMEGSTTGIQNPSVSTTFEDIRIHSQTNALGVSGTSTPTFTELNARNNTKTVHLAFFSGNLSLVNPDVDTWSFTYIVSPNGKIFPQYEFNLLVTYPNGTAINGTETGARVTVQHYGEGGGVDYNATLGENGNIPPQPLTLGFYNQANGDTLQNYNPFNLRIYNVTGYAEYNGNFTLNGIKNEVILMQLEGGYAGFPFLFFGLIIGVVIGSLVFASKKL